MNRKYIGLLKFYLQIKMKVKEIEILNVIEDIDEDCTDVNIVLEDNSDYIITLVTPKYLISSMDKKNEPFIRPGNNFVVVKKLTREIIEKAIKEIAKNKKDQERKKKD